MDIKPNILIKLLKQGNKFINYPNLTVLGNLDLFGFGIEELPINLTVKGYLNLTGNPIFSLPSSLNVRGSIYLSDSFISIIPEGFVFNGDVGLNNTRELVSLPKNIKIKGHLDLSWSRIQYIPSDLKAKSLNLMFSVMGNAYSEEELMQMFPKIKKIETLSLKQGIHYINLGIKNEVELVWEPIIKKNNWNLGDTKDIQKLSQILNLPYSFVEEKLGRYNQIKSLKNYYDKF